MSQTGCHFETNLGTLCLMMVCLLLLFSPLNMGQSLIGLGDNEFNPRTPRTEKVSVQTLPVTGWQLTFDPGARPSIVFKPGYGFAHSDWSHTDGLLLSMTNPDAHPIDLCFRIDDTLGSGADNHCVYAYVRLEPGEEAKLLLPLFALGMDMKAGPPNPASQGARVLALYGPKLTLDHVIRLEIFLVDAKVQHHALLHDIRWLPKPDMQGIVDRFGQFTRGDWPGKVSDDAQFTAAKQAERQWLDTNPAPQDRDEFGGWKSGPRLHATGFFRTALVMNAMEITPPARGESLPPGARWWLVTPMGSLFWSTGITCIYPHSPGPTVGREFMFTQLPPTNRADGQADFYALNLERKFGSSSESKWLQLTLERLAAWGFNTIGNWSQSTLTQTQRFPYTLPVHYGLPGHFTGTNLPDFFDEQFPQIVTQAIANQMEGRRDDPMLLGVFVDNEINWGAWHNDLNIPRAVLAAEADKPARRALVAQLKQRYSSVAAWLMAWGVTSDVTDWHTPFALPDTDKLTPQAHDDAQQFLIALAHRYYSVVAVAMKQQAPNHLYLGSRFGTYKPAVVEVSAQYNDVVSFNIYDSRIDTPKWQFLGALGKPVIIGEYHFGATDRGIFHPGLNPRMSQSERAAAMEAYLQSALAMPMYVGAHWFQYVDQPLTGRFDGENFNAGFVSVTDQPYEELRDTARRVNSDIYRTLHQTPASLVQK